MKIIQIVGNSNSGKTSFISRLIPYLKKIGSVAVVKHLSDHNFMLELEKDTTRFFETGADISVGIDNHKTVAALRLNDLDSILKLLAFQDMDFVVLEGFKGLPFPKIVIGSLSVEHTVLTNPSVDEVVSSLNLFAEFSG